MRLKSGISRTLYDRGSRTYVAIHLTCVNNLTVMNCCCRNCRSGFNLEEVGDLGGDRGLGQ